MIAFLPLLWLAGCGKPADDRQAGGIPAAQSSLEAASSAPAEDDSRIECALAGSTEFAPLCTAARRDTPEGRMLTISGPDGGFRRLLITRDGRGVIAADGAEPARLSILSPDRIEVAIGRDRYRLKALVKS